MLRIKKINESLLKLESPDFGILKEIHEYYSFYADNYKFMPKYKAGIWDGKIKLFNIKNYTFPIGLFFDLIKFLNERSYNYEIDKSIDPADEYDKESILSFIEKQRICDNTEKESEIVPYDYQIKAIVKCLLLNKSTVLSPTGSGKSLIMYLVSRFLLENNENEKQLIIVPKTQLVDQLHLDFLTYSYFNDYEYAKFKKIYSGESKDCSDSDITITTWQSVYQLKKSFFRQFDTVFVDEVHGAAAKSLTTIMNHCDNAKIKIGTTGTLSNNSQVNEMVIKGNFGPVVKTKSTSQLIDLDILPKLNINVCCIKYTDKKECAAVKKLDYHSEIKYLVESTKRNDFLKKIAIKEYNKKENNLLILFKYLEHGLLLYDLIAQSGKVEKDHLHYISGNVKREDREFIRKTVDEKKEKNILVSSLGTFSTGINIKNLHTILFASPFKSQIQVLQTIGRGLRIPENNADTRIIDIIDDYSNNGKKKNYAYQHGKERLKIYNEEKFKFKIFETNL